MTKSIKPFVASSIMAISLFGGGTLAPLSTAMAVTCSGWGCDNTSPVTTGCSSGAVTKKTANMYNNQWPYDLVAKVELRFSSTCHTVWSRVVLLADHGATDVYTETTRTVSGPPPNYVVDDVDYNLYYPASAYSPQVYLPASDTDAYSAKACGDVTNQTVMSASGCTSLWTGI